MPVRQPVARSSTSASNTVLATLHALLVEVQEAVLGVVGFLQRAVRGPVVQAPELVRFVVGGRVERLAATELLDHVLDASVVRAVSRAAGDRHGRPEAEVDV